MARTRDHQGLHRGTHAAWVAVRILVSQRVLAGFFQESGVMGRFEPACPHAGVATTKEAKNSKLSQQHFFVPFVYFAVLRFGATNYNWSVLLFLRGSPAMTITVDATYENGTLKLERPLPLAEHEKVRVTVEQSLADFGKTVSEKGTVPFSSEDSVKSGQSPTVSSETPSLAQQTAGIIGWTGDVETFERILKEAEETFYE